MFGKAKIHNSNVWKKPKSRIPIDNLLNRVKYKYHIYSINRPGRLFEARRLLNFHLFQQVKYVYFATKQQC